MHALFELYQILLIAHLSLLKYLSYKPSGRNPDSSLAQLTRPLVTRITTQ